ncbi:MAG: YhjD/YihY/BrkB family envelope integrity protein [Planctomycetota bacterium]|jgi:membrane protein
MSVLKSMADGFRRLLTSPDQELTRWQRRGRFWVELSLHCARQLRADRAPQMAAALSYRTVFSLVPVFVLALIVLRLFYGDDALAKPLSQLLTYAGLSDLQLADATTGQTQTAADWIQQIVANVSQLNFAAIGFVGIGVLVYAALSLLFEIERSFNTVYRADTRRAMASRVASSWTILTLGPIGLLVSFYVGEKLNSIVASVGVSTVVSIASVVITFSISWLLLVLVYTIVPSARVRIRAALIGSFVAALLWEVSKWGFREYLHFATGYEQLYGSLGLLPVFLMWIYLTWLIVLFGLQLGHSIQTLQSGRRELRLVVAGSTPLDPLLRIAMLIELGGAFERGEARDLDSLAERLDMPESLALEVIQQLLDDGSVRRTQDDEGEHDGYALAKPAGEIRLCEVLDSRRDVVRSESIAPIRELLRMSMRQTTLEEAVRESRA